jgi:hypothetical protein
MFKVSGVVFVLLSALVAVTAAQSPSPAESTAIAHARRLYYNLQREGVRDLRCNAHPDWQQVLASMLATGADAKARALPYLSKIEFNVRMTAATTNVTPPSKLTNRFPRISPVVLGSSSNWSDSTSNNLSIFGE